MSHERYMDATWISQVCQIDFTCMSDGRHMDVTRVSHGSHSSAIIMDIT